MRDPRTDPRAGDLLRKAPVLRQVVAFMFGHVMFYEGPPGRVAKQGCALIGSWRRWCKGAEVLMRVEE